MHGSPSKGDDDGQRSGSSTRYQMCLRSEDGSGCSRQQLRKKCGGQSRSAVSRGRVGAGSAIEIEPKRRRTRSATYEPGSEPAYIAKTDLVTGKDSYCCRVKGMAAKETRVSSAEPAKVEESPTFGLPASDFELGR